MRSTTRAATCHRQHDGLHRAERARRFPTSRPRAPRRRARTTRLGVKGVGETGTIASTPGGGQRGGGCALAAGHHAYRHAADAGACLADDAGGAAGRAQSGATSGASGTSGDTNGANPANATDGGTGAGMEGIACSQLNSPTPRRRRWPRRCSYARRRREAARGWAEPVAADEAAAGQPRATRRPAQFGELRGIREDGDAVIIGAMTTYLTALNSPVLARRARWWWRRRVRRHAGARARHDRRQPCPRRSRRRPAGGDAGAERGCRSGGTIPSPRYASVKNPRQRLRLRSLQRFSTGSWLNI